MQRTLTLTVLLALIALGGGPTAAQAPRGQIEELVVLDNESVRLVLVTYPPGADSDLHFNLGPEVTIVQDGELVLFAEGRRKVILRGERTGCPTPPPTSPATRPTGRSGSGPCCSSAATDRRPAPHLSSPRPGRR